MQQLAPPPPPPETFKTTGFDGVRRAQFRLWLMLITAITVGFTAWFASFGPIPAILAILVAKHVIVAVAVRGLDVNISPQERRVSF